LIDTITIDLWNTLISNTAEDARRFHKARTSGIIEAFLSDGITIEEGEVGKALDLCYKKCWDLWTKNLDLTAQEQIEILMSLLPGGEEVSPDSLERIVHYFDVLTFSDELRIRKPDPQIFLLTLKRLESSPSGSIHIGDELQTDVMGAKGVGMRAIHFDEGGSGHQEIQSDYCVGKLEDVKKIVESLRQR